MTDGRTGRRTRMILWDAVRLTSSVQKHNTVLSENMLQKSNKKKGELTFKYQKIKFKLFKNFHLENF